MRDLATPADLFSFALDAGRVRPYSRNMNTTNRINSALPAATLAQRLASMSETELMFAARELAKRPDADTTCTAVLEALEARVSGPSFEAFLSEIYA